MRIDAQRAGAEAAPSRGAEAPVCAVFCVPRFHWPRLRRELRSFTPGVLDEEHHAGAVSSFHSDHVVFRFPFPRVKCSWKVSSGPFDGALVAQVCQARRDWGTRPSHWCFLSCG